jgi:hypothetical protein
VTCGLTLDRSGAVQVDNFLKIIDVRLGMRVLNVLQFQAGECLFIFILVWAICMTRVLFTGPTCVSFDPKYESCVQIGSSSGTVRYLVILAWAI